jgi:hypothetical protein
MPREIELELPDCQTTLRATLLEDAAPKTSEVVWSLLERPIEETLGHAWPYIPELWFWMPPVPELPFENATVFPEAGDIVFYHYDQPGGNYTSPGGREMAFDLGIYYAQGFSKLPACGWMSANLVAKITRVESMAPAIAYAMTHGEQRVIARRGTA